MKNKASSSHPSPNKPKKKISKIWIVFSNIFSVIFLVASLIPVTMAVMLFDAPGSENAWLTQLTALSILLLPFTSIASIIGSWVFYKKGNRKKILIFIVLPFLNLLLIGLLFYSIDWLCGGKLTC